MSDSTTSQSELPVAQPNSRWFNFRWRFLILIPAAFLVLLAVYGPAQHRQKQALSSLKEQGAIVRTEPIGLPFVDQIFGSEYNQKITEVYWLDAEVTDENLAVLENISTLRKIELTGTNVNGDGLKHLAGQKDLYTLHLGKTPVTDAMMPHLDQLPNLGILSLSETRVTDAGLEQLAASKGLERLFLDGTSVSDAGMEHLTHLSKLKELSLKNVPITDRGLNHLKKLKNLEILKIDNTQVTESGVADFVKTLPKCYVPRLEEDTTDNQATETTKEKEDQTRQSGSQASD